MFCHMSENWRGRSLLSHQVVVNLIANTTTAKGLRIRAALDNNNYPTGVKVTKKEMDSINITPARVQGDWNYTIEQQTKTR